MFTLLLLSLLFFKHFIADFVLQFDYMVREKGTYGAAGGIHHSLVHASFTFLILVLFCSNAFYIILLPLVDFVAHYHIDWAKMNLSKGLTPKDNKFWFWIGVDQLLHYLTYLGIAFIVI